MQMVSQIYHIDKSDKFEFKKMRSIVTGKTHVEMVVGRVVFVIYDWEEWIANNMGQMKDMARCVDQVETDITEGVEQA